MSNPTQPTTRPTVLIVDADRRVRGSLSALLELEQGVTVVGVAGDAATAIELVALHAPDVVVLDPRLPDVDAGVALLTFLRRRLPSSRLVVCACSDLGEGATALAAADAVLSKGVDPGAFVASVLGRDWAVVPPGLRVASDSAAPATRAAEQPVTGDASMSPGALAVSDVPVTADVLPVVADVLPVAAADVAGDAAPFARLRAGNAGKGA